MHIHLPDDPTVDCHAEWTRSPDDSVRVACLIMSVLGTNLVPTYYVFNYTLCMYRAIPRICAWRSAE